MNNKNYVYVVSKDGISDMMICMLENDILIPVRDGEILEQLIKLFKEG